jgi:tetrahydromethanopterin S-methyltransferase subunit G
VWQKNSPYRPVNGGDIDRINERLDKIEARLNEKK